MTCDTSWAAIPYFVTWYVYSNFIIINLFITAILDNFDAANKQFDAQKQKELVVAQNESIRFLNVKLDSTLSKIREASNPNLNPNPNPNPKLDVRSTTPTVLNRRLM